MSKITPATLMLGVFAVIFGLVGAYAVRRYLAQSEQVVMEEPPAPPPLVSVPIASMRVEAGRPLELHDIAILRMTEEEMRKRMKDGALPKQFMTNTEQIMNRMLREPMEQGDAFQTDMFYPAGQGPTVAEKLQPGLRAVNIAVEGTGVLTGYDGPGSMVDVVFRTNAIEDAGVPETTVTLLEGVEVLAIEAATTGRGNSTGAERVTLAVTAEQANALKIAEGRGIFALSLRNPDDMQIAGITQPQTLERLLNLPVNEDFITEIYRGTNRDTAIFPGRSYVPQPITQLPLAGLLHMRGMQQPASIEKKKPERDDTKPAEREMAPPVDEAKADDGSVEGLPMPPPPATTQTDRTGRSGSTDGQRVVLGRRID